MKSRAGFFPGAASLVLVVVVLAMSVMGMLSLMSANNDYSLSLRSAKTAEETYALRVESEEKLAELNELCKDCASLDDVKAVLTPDFELYGDEISYYLSRDNRYIDVKVKIAFDAGKPVLKITSHRQYTLMDGGDFDMDW